MIRIISALILTVAAALCTATEQPIQLADNPPQRHIVVPGDTLWGISSRFLKEPWRWPEIWRMNREQVKNPNRIFPGDVIVLDVDPNGKPLLRVQDSKLKPTIYSEQIKLAIPPIPPNVIEPFISAPLIVEAGELNTAARITATQVAYIDIVDGAHFYTFDYELADPATAKD